LTLPQAAFSYRILIVDDEPTIREVGKMVLETQGYEVITAGDGFEALLALKKSLPDIIISDLSMPNMNGFEFLSVVRRRFPTIPVIVISGEFTALTYPESVLTDAYFAKGQYTLDALFAKILDLICELPSRPRVGSSDKAAIWVKNDRGMVAVTCTDCLRTFPVAGTIQGVNTVPCEFCPCAIRFEVIGTLTASV
jgi:CheY-like chemotaxis protein